MAPGQLFESQEFGLLGSAVSLVISVFLRIFVSVTPNGRDECIFILADLDKLLPFGVACP